MRISTKTGDKGKTSLYRGPRVDKDHARIESLGSLDELSAYLSVAVNLIKNRKIKSILKMIQEDLIIMNAEIATEARFIKQLKKTINKTHVTDLEKGIKDLESKGTGKCKCFKVTNRDFAPSILNIARTLARRSERRITTLIRKRLLKNKNIPVYLNRLSDLLYLLVESFEVKKAKNAH